MSLFVLPHDSKDKCTAQPLPGGVDGTRRRVWRVRRWHSEHTRSGAGEGPSLQVAQSWPTLWGPRDNTVHGVFQVRILEWVAFPSPGDLPKPGIEPRSPALQADSLPAEEPGKHVFSVSYFLLEYSWLTISLVSVVWQSDSVIHIHVFILFQILFPLRLSRNTEHSFSCCTARPCWLSILKTAACTCDPKFPNYPFSISQEQIFWYILF